MLFTGLGRSVLGKNCARGLEYVLETSGTVLPNTDLPAGEFIEIQIQMTVERLTCSHFVNLPVILKYWIPQPTSKIEIPSQL